MMAIDYVLDYMKRNGVPLTREKYLEIAYMGNPPAELGAEQEAELPEQFRELKVRSRQINKRSSRKLGK